MVEKLIHPFRAAGKFIIKVLKYFFQINPDIRLSKQRLFIGVATTSLFLVIVVIVTINKNADLHWDVTYEGFNKGMFFIFRTPLAIVAATLPILGLIAAVHRSAQTEHQIQQIKMQNYFSNYYNHKKEYITHFKEAAKRLLQDTFKNITENVISSFYHRTYPNNCETYFSTEHDINWIAQLEEHLIRISYLLSTMMDCQASQVRLLLFFEIYTIENTFLKSLYKKTNTNINDYSYAGNKICFAFTNNQDVHYFKLIPYTLNPIFSRISLYAELLSKLKYLAVRDENMPFFNTSFYFELKYNDLSKMPILDKIDIHETNIIKIEIELMEEVNRIKDDMEYGLLDAYKKFDNQ